MTELESTYQNERLSFLIYALIGILISAGMIIAYIFGSPRAERGELVGLDGYVHLTRATDLYETGDWYHQARMKTNTPYGDTLPWSRPFDVLLLAGAIPLSMFMDFDAALYWWGVAISPVLLVIALIALHWTVRVLLSKDAIYFIIFIVMFQFRVLSCYRPGRPDHHGFLALLFVLMVGFGLRLVMRPFSRRLCWLAGAAAALAVWASIESMVVVGLTMFALGAFWIFQGRDFLRKNLHFSAATGVFVAIALLAERPLSEIGAVEYDRISIVYLCFFAFIAVFWIVAILINSISNFTASIVKRSVYSIIGVAGIAAAMWLLFPGFYKGPLADVEPGIYKVWFHYINELQPLLKVTDTYIPAVQFMGSFLIGAGFLVYLLYESKNKPERYGWILLIVLVGGYTILSLHQNRWSYYPQILLSIILAELLCRILNLIPDRVPIVVRALAKSAVIFVFSLGLLCAGQWMDSMLIEETTKPKLKTVHLGPLCDYLNQQAQSRDKAIRLLTYNNFASEILYRTDCEVVGSNYHRNGQGIVDNYAVTTAETDQAALDILKRRDIDLVVLWPDKLPQPIEDRSEDTSTFCRRLCDGQVPQWLTKVDLPEGLAEDFLVFETRF